MLRTLPPQEGVVLVVLLVVQKILLLGVRPVALLGISNV